MRYAYCEVAHRGVRGLSRVFRQTRPAHARDKWFGIIPVPPVTRPDLPIRQQDPSRPYISPRVNASQFFSNGFSRVDDNSFEKAPILHFYMALRTRSVRSNEYEVVESEWIDACSSLRYDNTSRTETAFDCSR